MAENVPLFHTMGSDDIAQEATEIESCCMNCYKNVSALFCFQNKQFLWFPVVDMLLI